MMVNPSEKQKETYTNVVEALETGTDKLRAGVKLNEVYNGMVIIRLSINF